jgi:hypothetical protein
MLPLNTIINRHLTTSEVKKNSEPVCLPFYRLESYWLNMVINTFYHQSLYIIECNIKTCLKTATRHPMVLITSMKR